MDELKKYLKVLAVHQFWILSGLVLIASAVIFYMTNSSISEMIASRTKTIDGKFQELNNVRNSVPTHPNSFSNTEMDQVFQALKTDVRTAWELQYNLQVPLLVWPDIFDRPEITKIFAESRPIEKFVDFPLNPNTLGNFSSVTVNNRRVYRDYIGPEFKRVAEIIGAKWKAKLGSASQSGYAGLSMGGSMGGLPGSTPAATLDPDELVRWAEASQQKLLDSVLPWYNNAEPPTVLEIYYAQEDLWLMTALMEIIQATNAGAVDNSQTIVREIEWIRMGKTANLYAGELNAGDAPAGGSSPYGAQGGPGEGYRPPGGGMPTGYSMGGKTEGSRGGGSAATVRAVPDPAEDRYVTFVTGSEFKPRKAADLRAAMKNLTTANAVDAIAKRVPIRMRLKVDPSQVHKLITACGSAKMMLEVYQLRWNTAPATAESASTGGEGGAGGGSRPTASAGGGSSTASDGGIGMSGTGGLSMSPGGASASTMILKPESEVTIEIFGLMYLYNPVNNQVLAADKVAVAPPANAAAPAPASQPGVAPTTPAGTTATPAVGTPSPATTPATTPTIPATTPATTPPIPNAPQPVATPAPPTTAAPVPPGGTADERPPGAPEDN
jgi:hypothetical protein